MKPEKRGIFSRLFMLFITLILLGVVSACGRKGDPVPIIPSDKSAIDHKESEGTK
ncbi:MAG: hypothetical protein HY807_00825 [Nitrospirae bacterium]|nr:hypothetical protein [Nitrospirota bacterium]